MPQVSLYMDKETIEAVEKEAKKEHLSVSAWVGRKIRLSLKPEWPEEWLSLFGSIQDETFRRPEQPSYEDDAPRKSL